MRTNVFILKDHVDGHPLRPIPQKEPAPMRNWWPFSANGVDFTPCATNGRRMAQTAAHLVDHIIFRVPVHHESAQETGTLVSLHHVTGNCQ
ncbi:hypothetical protein [Nitrosomonas eutropha]|uniref:hypothetical protein n=1 Tax=Nitrosomonas eutropha TaxID=916 RepID=UPI0015A10881|nr:hypothetical protein [Nitrosomonas eutropha]